MTDGSAGDLITVLLNSTTLAAFAVLVTLVVLSAIARRRWPQPISSWHIATGAVCLGILTVTQLPAAPLRELRQARPTRSVREVLTWPFTGIDVDATLASSGWWLNIVLFVPFGLCIGGLMPRRRVRSAVAVAATAAFVVESGQAFSGFRSADLADLLANFVGGITGCGLMWALRPSITRLLSRADGLTRRRLFATAAAASVLLIGVSALVLVESANSAQRALLDELETRYGSTTLETMHDALFATWDDDAAFQQFLTASSIRPNSIVRTATPTVQARYSDQYFGLHRCVFVTWHRTSVSFRRGAGDECTRSLGS
jgi:VanZ family protein